MTHQGALVFLHWFWTAFFALFGVYLATWCRNYLSAASADCGVKIPTDSAESRERLNAAIERRESAEGKPVPLGIWLGAFSVLLAAVAATGRGATCIALRMPVSGHFPGDCSGVLAHTELAADARRRA